MPPIPTPPINALGLARDAVLDLWDARRIHVLLALLAMLPRTLLELSGLIEPYYQGLMAGNPPPGYWRATALLLLWAAFWNTPMLILWYRRFLVGPHEMLRIGIGELAERSLLFVGYSFLLGLVVGVVFLLVSLLLSILSGGHSGVLQPGSLSLILIVMLSLFFFFGTRLILTFAGIPIGRRIAMRESWQRTTAIAGPVIVALALSVIGTLILSTFAHSLATLPITGPEGLPKGAPIPPVLHIVDLVLAPISYTTTALVTAIAARVYRSIEGPPLDAHGINA